MLRLYLGRPGFGEHVRRQALYFGTLAIWLAAPLAALAFGARGLLAWTLLPAMAVAVMAWRKRSLRLGTLSVATWSLNAAGMIAGFVRGGVTPEVITRWEAA